MDVVALKVGAVAAHDDNVAITETREGFNGVFKAFAKGRPHLRVHGY